MKIVTILGTRPEVIRLARVIPRLDELCDHTLVHTGQNFDHALSDLFFSELSLRDPDVYLGVRGDGFADRVGLILARSEEILRQVNPDRLLVLGDTDSALSAFVAKRLGIPVFHMEAGNRCFDDRVPEEVNRRVIDHCSDVLMPYTERSRANLIAEGIESRRIYVTGNPIYEVLTHWSDAVNASDMLDRLGLSVGGYFLMTVHRQENVDLPDRLRHLITAAENLSLRHGIPVICSTHPRTRSRLDTHGIQVSRGDVRLIPPAGLFDFVKLEQNARCILTDSGTVQEECCIFHVPAVTVRDTTERPETIECGSNMLSGVHPEAIARCVEVVLGRNGSWKPPEEYLVDQVSDTVASIVLSGV